MREFEHRILGNKFKFFQTSLDVNKDRWEKIREEREEQWTEPVWRKDSLYLPE